MYLPVFPDTDKLTGCFPVARTHLEFNVTRIAIKIKTIKVKPVQIETLQQSNRFPWCQFIIHFIKR